MYLNSFLCLIITEISLLTLIQSTHIVGNSESMQTWNFLASISLFDRREGVFVRQGQQHGRKEQKKIWINWDDTGFIAITSEFKIIHFMSKNIIFNIMHSLQRAEHIVQILYSASANTVYSSDSKRYWMICYPY